MISPPSTAIRWRSGPWAGDLSGHSIDSHHHMAEERPGELVSSLIAFLND
jgi:haloacetate dehalogenase